MLHVEFQGPSINIDRYFQLSAGGRRRGRKGGSKGLFDPKSEEQMKLFKLQGWEVGVDGGNSLGQEGYPAPPYCSLDCQNLALTWSSYLVLPES